MTRKRLDMRLDDEDRENLELIRSVHDVPMSKLFRYGLALLCDQLGIKKANLEDLLKKSQPMLSPLYVATSSARVMQIIVIALAGPMQHSAAMRERDWEDRGRLEQASQMPHRRDYLEPLSARLESRLGRLCADKVISEAE